MAGDEESAEDRRRRWRPNTFERYLVEVTMLFAAVSAMLALSFCVTAVYCRGVERTEEKTTNVTLTLPMLCSSLGAKVDARLAAAIAPICAAHVSKIMMALAYFVAFMLVYLMMGGWPGTPCARFRTWTAASLRVAFGLASTACAVALAWLLAVGGSCALCASRLDGAFSLASSVPAIATASAAVLLIGALYLRFAIKEYEEKTNMGKTKPT